MDRFVILGLVVAGIIGCGYLVRIYAGRKHALAIDSVRLDPEQHGHPRILAFYGPSCDACERQKHVFAELQRTCSDVFELEMRDATIDYDYARQFGLVMVPTTVVVSATGTICAINSGFTSLAKLESQLAVA